MSESVLLADWAAPASVVAGTTLRNGSEADLPAAPQWLDQVHGTRVVTLGSTEFEDGPPQADAVIGRRPGDICVVRTADCLPLLLCSSDGQEIAAIHAGWRGLAAGIITATLARMEHEPADLIAWLGPAIAQPSFEVGDEVRQAFAAADFACEENFVRNARGRWQANLGGLAADQLRHAGVHDVSSSQSCTFADAESFYSYRRDGETGRLFSFIQRE